MSNFIELNVCGRGFTLININCIQTVSGDRKFTHITLKNGDRLSVMRDYSEIKKEIKEFKTFIEKGER